MINYTPGWVVEPFGSPIDVDLSTEGAEWEHHLAVALEEAVSFGSFAGSSRVAFQAGRGSVRLVEYEARDSALKSRLWVTVADRRVLIAGDGPEDDAQITPWVRAVVAANVRMSQRHPTFEWVAVIGPAPNDHQPGMGLAAPATVGPLRLRPGGVRHEEHVRPSTPSLSSRGMFWSWPAAVEGRASGFNWWAAASTGGPRPRPRSEI
jgi:hypothetical protein